MNSKSRGTVALFGGTFDPVHNGHIQSAIELNKRLLLDELRFLPCHRPVHRAKPGCNSEQRLAMVTLAVESEFSDSASANGKDAQVTTVRVDDREMQRDGKSYSIETIEEVRKEIGDEVSLIWVMGTDSFAGFDQWYRWQDFLALAHIVVIKRPDSFLPTEGAIAELIETSSAKSCDELKQCSAGLVWFESLKPFPISATAIRHDIAAGKTVASHNRLGEHVPAVVLNYIEEHQLYR